MDASEVEVKESVPASRKLQDTVARALLKAATKLHVAKGKKVSEFDVSKSVSKDAVAAMLGPTGNLRAPTLRIGKKIIVGFNDELFETLLG